MALTQPCLNQMRLGEWKKVRKATDIPYTTFWLAIKASILSDYVLHIPSRAMNARKPGVVGPNRFLLCQGDDTPQLHETQNQRPRKSKAKSIPGHPSSLLHFAGLCTEGKVTWRFIGEKIQAGDVSSLSFLLLLGQIYLYTIDTNRAVRISAWFQGINTWYFEAAWTCQFKGWFPKLFWNLCTRYSFSKC